MAPLTLTATYKSSTATQNFLHNVPTLPKEGGSVHEKTVFLNTLRANASKLQGELNVFLTQKMEEDKAAEAAKGVKEMAVLEEREDEMYGEEDPEKDG